VLTIGSFDLRRWGASSGMAAAGAPLRRPGRLFGDGGGRGSSATAVAGAPLRRRSESSRGDRKEGGSHLNLNEVTRSARTDTVKNKRTCVRHKHLSTLVASASQPIQTPVVPGSSPGTQIFLFYF
jgi:hypothetical protein